MSKRTVNQPSAAPTRKLTAAVIATAGIETSRIVVTHVWPGLLDLAFWSAMLPLAVFAVGYWVKDEPNVDLLSDPEA